MAIKYYGSQIAVGTAAERGAATWTGSPNGYRFLETDTLKTYIWSGSAWFEQVVSGIGGTVAIANGGTGQTTASAGFNALSPMTTAGDIIYGGASGTRTRLGIGTANQLLRTNSGATAPEWASTLSGLTLDAATNTFSNIHVLPSIKRTGSYQPMAINAGASGMCQGNLTTIAVGTGASGSHSITSAGGRLAYTTGTTINSLCGVRGSAVLNLERDLNCYIKGKFANTTAVTTLRFFFGLTSSTAAPVSSADPLPSFSGVGFWFDSGVHATNIAIAQNDGSASSDITTIPNLGTMNTAVHTYALRADNANSKFQYSFDGGTWTDINTKIPASNTPLGWTCFTECLAASARIMAVYYVETACDSP